MSKVESAVDYLKSLQPLLPENYRNEYGKNLGVIWMRQSLEEDYKRLDAMMDDAASALTAKTGVDVRQKGLVEALDKLFDHRHAEAICHAIHYVVAKQLKELIDE